MPLTAMTKNLQAASWSLRARWLFPVEGPPLERAALVIRGERLGSIESDFDRPVDLDLGDVAVLPGLVNAHTHLDLTGARGQLPPEGKFTDWLRAVIRHRQTLTAEQVETDIRAGIAESVAHGTTLIGDISGQGLSWPALAAAPVWAVVFHELLGLPRPRARQAWEDVGAWLKGHPATATCRPGLSPHAPYSVRASLFRLVAGYARRHPLPVAIHLAESRAELELLDSHAGQFQEFLAELGVWDANGLIRGPAELAHWFAGIGKTSFVHANYLNLAMPMPPGASVIYCPRTHAVFGHAPHPFRDLLAAGVNVALGTDSLASNPDLDILAEARFLARRFPEVPGSALLRMATLAGAEALGWDHQTGSLAPGKSADLVVVPLEPRAVQDPHSLVLQSDLPVRAVLWRGRWVHGQPAP